MQKNVKRKEFWKFWFSGCLPKGKEPIFITSQAEMEQLDGSDTLLWDTRPLFLLSPEPLVVSRLPMQTSFYICGDTKVKFEIADRHFDDQAANINALQDEYDQSMKNEITRIWEELQSELRAAAPDSSGERWYLLPNNRSFVDAEWIEEQVKKRLCEEQPRIFLETYLNWETDGISDPSEVFLPYQERCNVFAFPQAEYSYPESVAGNFYCQSIFGPELAEPELTEPEL